MPRFLRALIFSLCLWRQSAGADEWISDSHRCALTFPEAESWLPGTRQGIPAGEIVFHSNYAQNSEGIMVIVVPDQPTSDVANPAFVKNIGEILTSVGFAPETYAQVPWLDRPSGQFVTQRKDAVYGSAVGVARVTVRERKLYVVMAYGKGTANRADDKRFTRVLDTFRFVDKGQAQAAVQAELPASYYRLGSLACAASAFLLALMFGLVMFLSARKVEERA